MNLELCLLIVSEELVKRQNKRHNSVSNKKGNNHSISYLLQYNFVGCHALLLLSLKKLFPDSESSIAGI